MYIVVGASQSRKPTWRAVSFFLSGKVPKFDRPPFWLSLISQERKITDFRVLRLGLPLSPLPTQNLTFFGEDEVPNGICVSCFLTLSSCSRGTGFTSSSFAYLESRNALQTRTGSTGFCMGRTGCGAALRKADLVQGKTG